jgi:RNA polymerase-binding transcription factor DksA
MMTATKRPGDQPLVAIQNPIIGAQITRERQHIQKLNAAVITGENRQMGGCKRQGIPIDKSGIL